MFKPNPISLTVMVACQDGMTPPNDIERCVVSIAGIADEIVILDNRSWDMTWATLSELRTVAPMRNLRPTEDADSLPPAPAVILRRYEHEIERVKLRNDGLSMSSGAWVLLLNADEWLDDSSAESVAHFIREDANVVMTMTRLRQGEPPSEAIRLFPNLSGLMFAGDEPLILRRNYEDMPPIRRTGMAIQTS